MGYQESLVYLRPQRMFDAMVRKCEQAYKEGFYRLAGAEPVSIVTLKQPLEDLPKGAKLLWVCGDRCFHNENGILNGHLKTPHLYRMKIIPADRLFQDNTDEKLRGIDLGVYHTPTENACLRRESFHQYVQRLHNREKRGMDR